jgi:dihydroorotase-like cyclic amidohydrolase
MNPISLGTQTYADVGGYQADYGQFTAPTITSTKKNPAHRTIKENLREATKIASLIGVATVATMLIEAPEAPSHINTYSHIFNLKDQASISTVLPYGYQVINNDEVIKYLIKHPDLKSFLESGLNKFKAITGSTNLALEYEGIKEEEWENLYVIIHLDDYDEQHINDIENTLFEEWLNEAPEAIIQNLTISIS